MKATLVKVSTLFFLISFQFIFQLNAQDSAEFEQLYDTENVTASSENTSEISDTSTFTNEPKATYKKAKNGSFYSKWWFSLLIVVLVFPYFLRKSTKKNNTYKDKISTLSEEVNTLKKTLELKEKELIHTEEKKEEESAENEFIYQTEGISKLSEILSKNKNNTSVLGQKIISEIVHYTGANSGAIYIIKDENADDPILEFLGGFAPSSEQIAGKFKVGEGYVGTCFREGKTMELSNTSESYLKVASGLGEAKPAFIAFIPLIQDEIKLGVIEIASFKKLENYKINLIEKFSENFASTLALNRANEKMHIMLEQSREQALELKEQEEKLRQNLEEMQATQEELQRKAEENVQIQKDLSKETALLNALLNNIPEYIYFKDLESKFIKNSKSIAKSFGFDNMEALKGKTDFDFFDDEHAMPAYNDEQEIIRTEKPIIDLIEKEVKKDGSVSYVSTTKMPLRDMDGNIIGTFGISKDVTKQKKIEMDIQEKNEQLLAQEEELRQNLEEMQATQEEMQRQVQENIKIQEELKKEKALMDALMSNIPDAIYFKDLQSKFLKNSMSQVRMFGFDDPKMLLGKSDFDFFDDEHAMPAYQDEQKIIKTGKPIIDLVEKEVKKDGTVSWVSTTKMPLRDYNGKIIGTFGISKNITDLKKLEDDMQLKNEQLQAQEEELRQNLEEMQATQEELQRQMTENLKIQEDLKKEQALVDALMDNIPDYIYFKDQENRFIKNSRSHVLSFGVTDPKEILGKSDLDFFSEEQAKPKMKVEKDIMKSGKAIIDLVERIEKDGKDTWISTTKMPLKDKDGKIVGTFGISKDITQIKMMEMSMKEQNEQLQAQEEELRQNLEEMQTTQEELQRQMNANNIIQEELKKEKALVDALMDNIPDYIYFKDLENRFIKNSRSHVLSFGVTDPKKLLGKSDLDFFSKEQALPKMKVEQDIIRTGKPIIDLLERVEKDGKERWINTTKMPLKNEDGKIIGTFGISKDVTDLKKMEIESKERVEEMAAQEEELRQNLEEMQATQEELQRQSEHNKKIQIELEKETYLLNALLNNIPDFIYFKDLESKFIKNSLSHAKVFGCNSSEEISGKSDFDFFDEEHARPAFNDEQKIIKTGKPIIDLEEKEVKKDGSISWVSTTKMPLKDINGKIVGTFGISKNISHHKNLEILISEKDKKIKKLEEEIRKK